MKKRSNPFARKVLPLLLMASLSAGGCALSSPVLHKPVRLETVEPRGGIRPRAMLRLDDSRYRDFVLPIELPDSQAMLYVGQAMVSAYEEALAAFFTVMNRLKYSDFTANVSLGELTLKISYLPENPSPGEEVTAVYSLSHRIIMFDNRQRLVADVIPLRSERRTTFSYAGPDNALKQAARQLEDMLAEMEMDLYERLKAGWDEDRYKVWR